MDPIVWTGVLGVLLISGIFYFIRRSVFLFVILSATCISGVIVYNLLLADGTDSLLLLCAGLLLYAFGLLSVRTMLRRSVSLDMLRFIRVNASFPEISEPIAKRLEDAQRYRLIRQNDECTLTLWGRFMATAVAISYVFSSRTGK